MDNELIREFNSEKEATEFYETYAVVWQAVGENYASLGKSVEEAREGVNLAAIYVLDNPTLFESYKGLKATECTESIRIGITMILGGLNSNKPYSSNVE